MAQKAYDGAEFLTAQADGPLERSGGNIRPAPFGMTDEYGRDAPFVPQDKAEARPYTTQGKSWRGKLAATEAGIGSGHGGPSTSVSG
jgi:hypothetical protein